jgi:hypothetical protein
MTTSNSVDFELDAQGIISEAYKALGIRAAETPLQSFEIQDGLNCLNLMLKSWQKQGMHLWEQEEGIIFLDKGKESYLLGPSGDEACLLDDFIGTTATAANITNDTVISVASSTGMVALDFAGILLADGTRHWTTLASVDSSIQVTLTTGITNATLSGATLFTFTNLIQRPLRISSSRRKTFGVDSEIQVFSWSRNEYFNQVNKTGQGTVVQAYYSPLRTNGRYYVWQTASSANDYLRVSFERPIQDIDLETETLDIPQEWQETVIYNLAARLGAIYSVPMQKMQTIMQVAAGMLQDSIGWDEEIESLNIQVDFS